MALLTTRSLGDVLPDLEVVLEGARRVVVEGVVLVVEAAVTLAVLLEAAGVDVEEDDFFPPHPAGTATLSTASMAAIPLLEAKRWHAFIGKAAYSADNDRMLRLLEAGGKRLPFLRWSVLRMLLARRLTKEWQVGDGREEALAQYVTSHAAHGDLEDVIRTIDEFCYSRSFMINVGDEKGEILDAAVRRAAPRQALELGTYCGYSGLRIAGAMPEGGRLASIELNPANAEIARRIWDHARVGDHLAVLVGTLGDSGATVERLEAEHGFGLGSLDFVFIDHAKDAYLLDLERIVDRGWLHAGSIVVADNIKLPGAPEYRAYMRTQEGNSWRSIEHQTHAEYQTLLKDVVLESEYIGG